MLTWYSSWVAHSLLTEFSTHVLRRSKQLKVWSAHKTLALCCIRRSARYSARHSSTETCKVCMEPYRRKRRPDWIKNRGRDLSCFDRATTMIDMPWITFIEMLLHSDFLTAERFLEASVHWCMQIWGLKNGFLLNFDTARRAHHTNCADYVDSPSRDQVRKVGVPELPVPEAAVATVGTHASRAAL